MTIHRNTYTAVVLCTILSIGSIMVLFFFTKRGPVRDGSFKRRFLYEAPNKIHELDLKHNGHYFAGTDGNKIYLGSKGNPLRMLVLDATLQDRKQVFLEMDRDSLPYRSPQLRVVPPYFFVIDGTIPYLLKGDLKSGQARSIMKRPFYFNDAEIMDADNLVFRKVGAWSKKMVMGTLNLKDSMRMMITDKLLEPQIDGIFDVDGTLSYNRELGKLIYTYRYRNQYIVADRNLDLQYRGGTIDTLSQAQIEIGHMDSKGEIKMSKPVVVVNRYSTTSGEYLFVNSNILGKAESLELWKNSSAIDVYNLKKKTYEFSFYIHDIGANKLRSFQVFDNKFIGLIGSYIVIYELDFI